jgi:Tfp pilus assembly protein PilF
MSQAEKIFAQRARHSVIEARKMKFLRFLSACVGSALIVGSAMALIKLTEGESLPDFQLQDAKQRIFTLKDFEKRPLLFAYVRMDQDDSQTLLEKCKRWQDELPDLQIAAILNRPAEEPVNYPFPLLVDTDKSVYSKWGIRVFPTVILVDREGRVAFTHSGFGSTAEEIIADEIAVLTGVKTRDEIEREKESLRAQIPTEDTAGRHFQAGKKLWDDGFLERAKTEWEKALQADSSNTPANLYLARYYLRIGEPDVAEEYLRFVLEKEETPEALILMARSYLRQGDLDQSEEYANRALDANRRSPEAKLTLAEIYLEQNDLSESEAYIQEVMLITKHNPKAYYLMGRIAEVQGNPAEAIENYRHALELLITE